MSDIKLNSQQQAAVTHPEGPLLIVAGAGTGKTTVVTERIKWLIAEKGYKPEQILALTFTEKAAAEMEERVDVALPLGYSRTWILTFHGFCERVLREEAIHIGLDPGFTILSEAETQLLIKNNMYDFELDYFRPKGNPTKFIGGLITHFARLKDEDISPTQYLGWVRAQWDDRHALPEDEREQLEQYHEVALAYERYEQLKIEHSVMDFGDLISNTLKVFRERPNVLARYQERFPYVLIDEFQDTNYAQNHLAVLLAGDHKNITVVADDDQSIYRWRGAAVYNVMDFRTHFPSTKVITLTQNYRSRQEILDHSYNFIQHNNPDRLEVREEIDKRLESGRSFEDLPPQSLEVIWGETVEREADCVVDQIQKLQPEHYSDVAILIRANSHAEPFIRALIRSGIPYQYLGPGKLFKQPEIRDLIAYLKVLANFNDNQAMYRVLENSLFAISGRDVAWLVNQAKETNRPLFRVLETFVANPDEYDHGMNDETLQVLSDLKQMIHRHLDSVSDASPRDLVAYFLVDTKQTERLKDPQSEVEQKQAENIVAFMNKINEFETQTPDAGVHEFVEYLDFLMDAGESPVASDIDWRMDDAVNILTVHSSKGLEFDYVFVVNMVNLRFPSMNRKDQIPLPEDIIKEPAPSEDPHVQEERRLFYVALTRAKKKVYLTGAKFYHEGKRAKKISPFVLETLGEIEPYLVDAPPQEQRLFDIETLLTNDETDVSVPEQQELRRITYLNYSMINTFEMCPLHYKLEYLLNLPKAPSGAANMGTAVHNTLRDIYSAVLSGEIQKDLSQALEKADHCFDVYWSPVGFVSKDQEDEMYVSGKRMVKEFLEKDFEKTYQLEGIEVGFNVNIAPDLRIGGRIDRINKKADGVLEIIDYKTGSKPSDSQLKKDLQLPIYAMAAHHENLYGYPLDKICLTYHYLDAGETLSFQKDENDLIKAKEEILEIRDEIQNSDFSCSGSYFCQQGCEYNLFCG